MHNLSMHAQHISARSLHVCFKNIPADTRNTRTLLETRSSEADPSMRVDLRDTRSNTRKRSRDTRNHGTEVTTVPSFEPYPYQQDAIDKLLAQFK